MRFNACYAGASVCAPSRSVLMTGQHTGHTRVRSNCRCAQEAAFRSPAKTSRRGGVERAGVARLLR